VKTRPTLRRDDAAYLDELEAARHPRAASERARLEDQQAEIDALGAGDELEPYEDAFARLVFDDAPTAENVKKHGVVRRRRKKG